jgi:hypothetical protein
VEPHVCRVNLQTADPQAEWVEVANGGVLPVALTGLEITDYTLLQRHVHVIRFPSTTTGSALMLAAGQSAFVFSGIGQNRWDVDENGRSRLFLFAGRQAPVWNNAGDVVYLRRVDGTFVDSVTVGDPPRHPNGH